MTCKWTKKIISALERWMKKSIVGKLVFHGKHLKNIEGANKWNAKAFTTHWSFYAAWTLHSLWQFHYQQDLSLSPWPKFVFVSLAGLHADFSWSVCLPTSITEKNLFQWCLWIHSCRTKCYTEVMNEKCCYCYCYYYVINTEFGFPASIS